MAARLSNGRRFLLLQCSAYSTSGSDPFQRALLQAFTDETLREAKSYLSILSLIYAHAHRAQANTDMSCQTIDTRPLKERMSDAGVVKVMHEGHVIKMQCPNLGTVALHSSKLLQVLQVLTRAGSKIVTFFRITRMLCCRVATPLGKRCYFSLLML